MRNENNTIINRPRRGAPAKPNVIVRGINFLVGILYIMIYVPLTALCLLGITTLQAMDKLLDYINSPMANFIDAISLKFKANLGPHGASIISGVLNSSLFEVYMLGLTSYLAVPYAYAFAFATAVWFFNEVISLTKIYSNFTNITAEENPQLRALRHSPFEYTLSFLGSEFKHVMTVPPFLTLVVEQAYALQQRITDIFWPRNKPRPQVNATGGMRAPAPVVQNLAQVQQRRDEFLRAFDRRVVDATSAAAAAASAENLQHVTTDAAPPAASANATNTGPTLF